MNALCVDGIWVAIGGQVSGNGHSGHGTARGQSGTERGHAQPTVPSTALLNHLLSLVFRTSGTCTSWRALETTSG